MTANRSTKFYIGTSGWSYQDWKGGFYPKDLKKDDWLPYFSRQFNTVEINSSFYREIKPETYKTWKEKSEKDFLFTIKATRYLTHIKKLNDATEIWKRFIKGPDNLGKKLGPILVQLPPNFKANAEKLENFLKAASSDYKIAFEPRNKTWLIPEVFDILKKYNTALVISDTPEWPSREEITADFVYLRLHGPEGLYDSEYSEKQIKDWARKLKDWSKSVEYLFVYFNNDHEAKAVKNANQLIKFLNS